MSDQPQEIGALLEPGREVRLGQSTYTVASYVDNGGTGEVYRCVDSNDRAFALKLYLPELNLFRAGGSRVAEDDSTRVQMFVDQAIKIASHEQQTLEQLDHPGVVRVVDVGDISLKPPEKKRLPPHLKSRVKNLPVMISEFVRGQTLDRALTAENIDNQGMTNVLSQVAAALDYVHSQGLLHADVRASNVMIRASSGAAVLVDFAATKNLNLDSTSAAQDRTLLAVDSSLLSPNLPPSHALRANGGLYEISRGELKSKYFPWLDTMQFAMLLASIRQRASGLFDRSELEYLDLLVKRFDFPRAEKWASTPLAPLVDRLAALHSYPFGVPELVAPSVAESTVSLVSGITVPVSGVAEQFIANRSFERLSRIQQLSMVSQVYPAADYKRSVHALHTYDIARQMVVQLFGTPLFRSVFDRESAQQLLICALLHDINHFPFLHILQEARDDDGEALIDNDRVLDLFCNGVATGEKLAGKPSIYEMLSEVGIEQDRFKRLLFGEHSDQRTPVDQVINSIISSNVDIDKISYLMLDSIFTGVKYGSGIDLPTLLKAARIAPVSDRLHLAFDPRAIPAMESVFLTRYWNFRTIYWRHTNRAIMSMILSVVRDLYLIEGRDNPNGYLRASIRLDDHSAARWLDDRYVELNLGSQSILRPLLESREGLFKRLFSVRPRRKDDEEVKLAGELQKLVTGKGGYQRELMLLRELSGRLSTRYKIAVNERDLLLDVPRRDLGDRGGAAFVVTGDSVKPLDQVSRAVEAVWNDFDLLSQHVRFFVSPRVAEAITKEVRERDRLAIREDVASSLRYVREASGVRKGIS